MCLQEIIVKLRLVTYDFLLVSRSDFWSSVGENIRELYKLWKSSAPKEEQKHECHGYL